MYECSDTVLHQAIIMTISKIKDISSLLFYSNCHPKMIQKQMLMAFEQPIFFRNDVCVNAKTLQIGYDDISNMYINLRLFVQFNIWL